MFPTSTSLPSFEVVIPPRYTCAPEVIFTFEVVFDQLIISSSNTPLLKCCSFTPPAKIFPNKDIFLVTSILISPPFTFNPPTPVKISEYPLSSLLKFVEVVVILISFEALTELSIYTCSPALIFTVEFSPLKLTPFSLISPPATTAPSISTSFAPFIVIVLEPF